MEHHVAAPDQLAERVISRISVDPRLREAGSVFADMFSLGFRTLQVVFGNPDDDGAATDSDDDRSGPSAPGATEGPST
jgi:hypothetical protein